MKRGFAAACLWLFATTVAGATAGPHGSVVGPISDIRITENGQGPAQDLCSQYRVTAAQVRRFFSRAIVITPMQEHDSFLHGPCSARGTFKTRYGEWRWEMRNLGTGSFASAYGDDGTFMVADPAEESSLGDE